MSWIIPSKTKNNKYGNRRVERNGVKYDSSAEEKRGAELELLERAGEIEGLKRQVKYLLIPAQFDADHKKVENPCYYIADFQYRDNKGYVHVEDVKGMRTREYIIKRKLMLKVYGIRIEEVKA